VGTFRFLKYLLTISVSFPIESSLQLMRVIAIVSEEKTANTAYSTLRSG
jgi:hypothetical protein